MTGIRGRERTINENIRAIKNPRVVVKVHRSMLPRFGPRMSANPLRLRCGILAMRAGLPVTNLSCPSKGKTIPRTMRGTLADFAGRSLSPHPPSAPAIEWCTEVLYVATAPTGKDHPMLVGLAPLQLQVFTIDAVQAGLLNAQV